MSLDPLLDSARAIARSVLLEERASTDRDARWPESGMRALQAELGGLVVPADAGGLGQGMSALARVCEELAGVCPSTAICFGMHCVGAAVIAAKATDEQRSALLEPIARGRHLTTLGLSEPGTGSHFYIPQARMDAGPDGFRVTGTKSFVTNGGHADSYVISTAAAGPDANPGEFSCLVLPGDAEGIHWEQPWEGWGMRGNSARNVRLEGVRIPRENLLGRPGDEIWYVFQVIAPYFITAMAGTYLGIAAAALEEARGHLLDRRHAHSGLRLAEQPVVQHRIGVLWAMVERTRSLVYAAAAKGDAGAADALPALCSAKAEVADCAVDVASAVMTLQGGRAYRERSRIQQLYRDARAAHVMAPTTDMLRSWTGRAFLGLPLLGE